MPRNSRGYLFAGGVVFLGIIIFRLFALWTASPERLVSLTPDDAYYYYEIALNSAAGLGSTFDKIHATNGYHPLWMMVCTAAALAGGFSTENLGGQIEFVRLMVTLEIILGVWGVVLLVLAHRKMGSSYFAAGITVTMLALPWSVYGMTDGLETGAATLFFCWSIYVILKDRLFEDYSTTRHFAFGCLLSLLVLSRLDMIFFPMAYGIVFLLGDGGIRSNKLKPLIACFFPLTITLLIYWLLNYYHFHSLMPISGKLKNTFPHPGIHWGIIRANIISLGAAVVAMGLLLLDYSRSAGNGARLSLCGAGFLALFLVNVLLFTDWGIQPWYFFSAWLWLAFAGGRLLDIIEFGGAPLRITFLAGASCLAIAGQWMYFRNRLEGDFKVRSYQAAMALRGGLLPGRVVGMSDCGVFGYFRPGDVVNLDGVVNNAAYQSALVEDGLFTYLKDSGIVAIAHHAVPDASVRPGYDTYTYRAFSHLYKKSGGSVDLREHDEVYRSDPYDDGMGLKRFVIWKVHD